MKKVIVVIVIVLVSIPMFAEGFHGGFETSIDTGFVQLGIGVFGCYDFPVQGRELGIKVGLETNADFKYIRWQIGLDTKLIDLSENSSVDIDVRFGGYDKVETFEVSFMPYLTLNLYNNYSTIIGIRGKTYMYPNALNSVALVIGMQI